MTKDRAGLTLEILGHLLKILPLATSETLNYNVKEGAGQFGD